MAKALLPLVFVIDDEPLVARTIPRLLRGRFDVALYGTGQDALFAIGSGKAPDAVLCDMHLPDMTGVGVHQRLRTLRPDLVPRLLFMTGGSGDTPHVERFLDAHRGRVLYKPFEKDRLIEMLERVLEHR